MRRGTPRLFGAVICAAAFAAVAPAAGAQVKAPRVTTVTVTEGPRVVAKFTVTLPKKARGRINVPYRTVAGTAKAGADYTAKRGRLIFRRGQRKKSISVRVLDDTLDEPNETFRMRISAVKRRLKAKSATATIVDDDPGLGPTTQTGQLPPPDGDGGGGGGTTAPPTETCNGFDDDQDGTKDDGVCVVTVTMAGSGSGTVTSDPAGINCPGTCSASIPAFVTLTAAPASKFIGWGGACSGTAPTCNLAPGEHAVTATFTSEPAAGEIVINEIHADPSATAGDANGDATISAQQDEFVELVNVTAAPLNLADTTLADSVGIRHTFDAGTIVQPGCAIVVFGGGTPNGTFGGSEVNTADTGGLDLTNTGDTVTLALGGTTLSTHTYGAEGGNDQSLTRSPDVTGPFAQHTTASGNVAMLFSPGENLTGAAFGSSC